MNAKYKKQNSQQIPLDAPRFQISSLTQSDISKIVTKLKKRGVRILKVNIEPVDKKEVKS